MQTIVKNGCSSSSAAP